MGLLRNWKGFVKEEQQRREKIRDHKITTEESKVGIDRDADVEPSFDEFIEWIVNKEEYSVKSVTQNA